MQTALHTGIHRCSRDGQTLHKKKGEKLPPCSCERGTWEFLATDNNRDPIPLFIGVSILHATEIDEFPEVGEVLNLRGALMDSGSYRVTKIDLMQWDGNDNVLAHVEKVGDMNPALPIHPCFTPTRNC